MNKPYFNTGLTPLKLNQTINWWNKNGHFNTDLYQRVLFLNAVNNFENIEPSEEGSYELFINEILINKANPEKEIAKFIIKEKRFVARVWFTITSLIVVALSLIVILK